MKTTTVLLLLLSYALMVTAQEARIIIDIPSTQKPWSSLDVNNKENNFQFAIVTDRTGGARPGIFMKGISKLNLLQPEFVMSVGDFIQGYTTDVDRLDQEWSEFNGFIDSLQAPFFYVPGNHDITNKVMEDKWKELYGVTYYHFVYKDVLFLCLNSEDNYRGAGRGSIGDEQFEYIKNTLAENKDVRWTFLFMHQPLWTQEDTKRWKEVEDLLQDRDHNVYAGHYHRYWKTVRNNGKYIALATTGGGSRLRGPSYGEFDHVVWMTMTEQGPIMANLLLDGVWDENVVTDHLADFVRNRPFPAKIEPAYYDNINLPAEKTEIILNNDSDYKMQVDLSGRAHPDVFFSIEESSIEVNPNSLVRVPVNIENVNKKNIEEIVPLEFTAEVSFQYPGRPNLAISESIKYKPHYKYTSAPLVREISIDGKLKEWGEPDHLVKGNEKLTGSPLHYAGESDCRIHFSYAHDDDYFYIAYEVIDDDLYTKEGEPARSQDAIVIGLDARPSLISSVNTGMGMFDDWLYFNQSLSVKNSILNEDRLPDGIISAILKTKKGYSGELAIPVSYLNERQSGSWKTVRLNVGVIDFDKNGQEKNELYWKPLWNSNANIPGSGMIFRKEE